MSSEENKICVNKNFLAELDMTGTIVTGVIMGLIVLVSLGGIIGLRKQCGGFWFKNLWTGFMGLVAVANLVGIGFIAFKQIERNNKENEDQK